MTSPPWQLRTPDADTVAHLMAEAGCPEPVAIILAARGLVDAAALRRFFKPALSDLHPPELMLGVRKAVSRIRHAVEHSEPILIYGDYDVDGTIATVLLKTAIERLAPRDRPATVTWHVPHRIREGYGMQTARLAEAAASGIRLVISVDTGIRAFAAAREAQALGLDLIVTDHHLADAAAGVPEAISVVNPAQPGCPYPCKELCGAAVAFKLAHALLVADAAASPDPSAALDRLNNALIPSLLKLVAIATIADSVPLIGENRTIAMLGLQGLERPVQPGLRALIEVSGLPLDRSPTAAEVGFRIAPRINAAGRMDIADDVIELFLTRSPERAQQLAAKLNTLNEQRRATEREALDAIEQQLTRIRGEGPDYPAEAIVLDDPAWHRGVLGLLASRVVDRTGRPAVVLTHEENGEAYGSGRSVLGFHLLDALTATHTAACTLAASESLLTRFGGHAHAVGLSLPSLRVPLLRERLQQYSAERLTVDLLSPPLVCDALVPAETLTDELAGWIERCAPFGNAHPEPVLLTRALTLAAPPRIIKDRHLCLALTSVPRGPQLQALGWSRGSDPDTSWAARAQSLVLQTGSRVDLVYRLRRQSNTWFKGLELDLVALQLCS